MKEYKKPTIQIVNLKSSDDIAISYKELHGQFINQYLNSTSNQYAITQYNLRTSTPTDTPVVPE